MNRIDRLFAILLYLQRNKRVRAADLARHFEVSERTIYRDMQALGESGVPIIALPSQGYELSEGYYVPPLLFTSNEAQALFLAAHLLQAQSVGQLTSDIEHALAKIALVLPPPRRAAVDELIQMIHFVAPVARFDLSDRHLITVQRAIQERRVLLVHYHSYSRNETTERQIEPVRLAAHQGVWYFGGHCRLRGASRDFRLDRVQELQLCDEVFTPRQSDVPPPPALLVRIRFALPITRWVRERQHYAFQHEEATVDGAAVMTYLIHTPGDIVPWLLSWGAQAEVLEPAELRAAIRQQARMLYDMLT